MPIPAYWSDAGGRWKYKVTGANGFSATDAPGLIYTKDGVGAEAKVDFRMAVYKAKDVPTTTTRSISATPLSAFQPWSYRVGGSAEGSSAIPDATRGDGQAG